MEVFGRRGKLLWHLPQKHKFATFWRGCGGRTEGGGGERGSSDFSVGQVRYRPYCEEGGGELNWLFSG